MASDDLRNALDLDVDLDNLYREETFTDLGAATVRKLTPVKADGTPDGARPVLYMGETSLMTQVGPVPVQFSLEVQNLEDAFRQFPEGVRAAVARLSERAREAMRAEASRIVVPATVPPGLTPPGGPRPGGKISFDW
jgi:hypothetical protein